MRTAQEIAQDNDLFRTTMILTPRHRIVITEGVEILKNQNPQAYDELIHQVRIFKKFNEDNNPWGERDFGAIKLDVTVFCWKFDYYSNDWEHGADPMKGRTNLLLTIMRADEY
jgi:hypothetical protein